MVKPVIMQVVGFQNSGKTTFVNQLTSHLTSQNFSVVTIKHHGHGGKPTVMEEKDSSQHILSGASASLVEGDGRLVLQAERKEWLLEEQIELMSFLQPDFIIIEGHKRAGYQKVLLLGKEEDKHLIHNLENMIGIFHWEDVSLEKEEFSPTYLINDHKGLIWLSEYLKSQL